MKNLPVIFLVDDDPQVLRAISRDVKRQYRKQYRVLETASAKEALSVLEELKKKGETVALFLSDQRMPEMLGVAFLEQARQLFPEAKKALLTAYSDTDAAIKAINDVQLDYYLMKPWDPPAEKLYPVLDDLLEEWQANFIPDTAGIRVVGYQFSPKSHELKDFLSGNLIPYRWLDVESSAEANELLGLHGIDGKGLPAVFFEDGSVLTGFDMPTLVQKLGRSATASARMYDVVIVGAGPAGLAAAVYGGSEGLRTLLVERRAPGGQAGTSSRIENYLGFPKGLSGADLSRRAITQATRFGVEFLSPQSVAQIELADPYKIVHLADGSQVNARSVVVTVGVDYRKLDAPGLHDYTGAGVYYGAAMTEAHACKNQEVYVVGGGNSAGQGAMYLSKFAKNVYIVIRKPDLSSSMSQYLIDQIDGTPNIHVLGETVVAEAHGQDERLTGLTLEDYTTKARRQVPAGACFIFIGTRPMTDWLPEGVIKNKRGFVETGIHAAKHPDFKKSWKLKREPYLLETSVPGIFAAGDVRAGAMNRVASAVGEGAMTIKFVHEYLAGA